MLKLGSSGPDVASFQSFLATQGFDPGAADGRWGAKTDTAAKAWQTANGLEVDGIIGPASFKVALAQGWKVPAGKYKFIPAIHFTPANRGVGDIDYVVIHATDGGEKPRQSENTAAWLADKASGGSAHYIGDPVQIVQAVLEKDVAWGAGGANKRGIHVEHCGRADQTAAQWDDDNSRAELILAAGLVADICKRYSIPVRRLTAEQIKAGERGIVGHAECVKAFPGTGAHYDPGPSWPWDRYIAMVSDNLAALGG